MSNHTPGPWIIDGVEIRAVSSHESESICVMSPCFTDADASLIAAAPDLLEALKAFERIKDIWLPLEAEEQHAEEMYALHMAGNKMLAAIAKAKGVKS